MRVLYVATDLRDADILQQEVKRAAPKLVLDVCAGAAEGRTRAERSLGYDVMLLDSSLGDAEQLTLIQHVRSKQIPLPIALLASQATAPSSTLVSAADECITRGPRLAERLAPGLRMAVERYRIVATTLRDNERLKRSEARLRLIIEALPAGVVLVDQNGKILAMNVAGSTLVGTSGPSDVVGRELYSLADADGAQRLRELMTRAIAGERGRTEFECHGTDGALRRLTIDALCIQRDEAAAQGSVLGVLATAVVETPSADGGVEFSFGGDVSALADERAALEQALDTMRVDVDRLEQEAATERGRVQQLLAELERARATSAEHHAHRTALDERSRETVARIEELEAQRREEQAAMEAVVSRAGTLNDEASGLRQERQRLAHEADALKQELLEQRRARLELEERIAAADIERERLTTVLASAQSASEARVAQLEEELRTIRASIATATTRERGLVAELDATRFEASRLRDDLVREGDARARFETELGQVRDALQAALSARDADQTTVASKIADVQTALDAAGAREQSLGNDLAAVRAQEQAVRSDLEAALSREQALQIAADAAAAAQREADARHGAASERVTALEQAVADAGAREAALQADLGQSQSREQWLQNELSTANSGRAELEGQVAQIAQREQQLQGELWSATSARTDLDGQLAQALDREQQLRNELMTVTSTRDDLDGQLAQALDREQQLRNELMAATSARTDLDGQLAQALDREQQLRNELMTATSARNDLDGQLAQALDREQQLRNELTTATSVRADLDAQIADAQARTTTLDAELGAKVAELEALSGELAASRFESTQLRDDLAREGEARAQLDDVRTQLAADLEARQFDLSTLRSSTDADRDVFQARIAELEGETASAREREQALSDRVSRLSNLEVSVVEIEARRQAAVARVAELEERRRDEQSALSAAAQREADLARELLSTRDETTRLSTDRDAVSQELSRERDLRRSIEDELTVRTAEVGRHRTELDTQLASRDADLAKLRDEAAAGAQALREARESAARLESDARAQATRLEAELERVREAAGQAAEREAALASELANLQQERDARGRQAFELETVLARERDERIDLQSRLKVLERDAADAGARADSRLADMQRDHQEVVARLQKLLEQAAAREFQAAALARPSTGDRVRRRPAEKIGQLAAAMANDLNATVADMAEDARRLLAELPDGTTSRARAEQTLQTANRAGQLVRHLLRLSERESRMIPRVEISGLVRANEALLRQLGGADIDLRFELAAGLPHVECDAEEVVQVLSTLIVTVRGSLPLGGVIRVGTQDRGRGDGRRRSDQALVLTVSAEGYGMVPVPTVGCEEVVTRIGGVFSSTTDPNQSSMTLQALLPTEVRSADANPGWSQTA